MTIPLPGTMITSGTDLQQFWRGLMNEEGFAALRLWLIFLGEEQQVLPLVLPIDELPGEPEAQRLAGLARAMRSVGDEIGAVTAAMLLSRPGPGAMSDRDRRWARAIRAACGPFDWPLHLATEGRVQPFAPDDLV